MNLLIIDGPLNLSAKLLSPTLDNRLVRLSIIKSCELMRLTD